METLPELVLFSTDDKEVEALKARFHSESRILVVKGNGPAVTARCHLDAMWMTPMLASYFGLMEALPPHTAKVVPMFADKIEKGLPRLLVAGVALVPGKSYTPKYLSTIAASAFADTLLTYNRTHDSPILRVGSNPGCLGLDDLGDAEAFQAIREAFTQFPVVASLMQSQETHQVA